MLFGAYYVSLVVCWSSLLRVCALIVVRRLLCVV